LLFIQSRIDLKSIVSAIVNETEADTRIGKSPLSLNLQHLPQQCATGRNMYLLIQMLVTFILLSLFTVVGGR
jgi:hypothetical protein